MCEITNLIIIGKIPRPHHAHLAERIKVVDVENVAPPILIAVDVILQAGRENRLIVRVSVVSRERERDNGEVVRQHVCVKVM